MGAGMHSLQRTAAVVAPLRTYLATGEASLEIPEWASWTRTVPVDFDIYRIVDRRTKVEVLGIYVGNFPEFQTEKSEPGVINGLRVRQHCGCVNSKCTRDVLFALPNGSSDMYVEMWYGGLTPTQAMASDAMIRSLRYHRLAHHVFKRM